MNLIKNYIIWLKKNCIVPQIINHNVKKQSLNFCTWCYLIIAISWFWIISDKHFSLKRPHYAMWQRKREYHIFAIDKWSKMALHYSIIRWLRCTRYPQLILSLNLKLVHIKLKHFPCKANYFVLCEMCMIDWLAEISNQEPLTGY